MKKTTKAKEYIYYREDFISDKFLLTDPHSNYGRFLMQFFFSAPINILKKISDAADKMDTDSVVLCFFEEKDSSIPAHEIPSSELKNFRDRKIKRVNLSLAPVAKHSDEPLEYIIGVVF